MACEDVLSSRRRVLETIVRDGFDDAPAQVQGFVMRVLEGQNETSEGDRLYREGTLDDYLEAARFEGYPALARAGFSLGRGGGETANSTQMSRFIQCMEQQRGRPRGRQVELARDALVLLGIANGLRAVRQRGTVNGERLKVVSRWTRELLDQHGGSDVRLARARLLASDLLDDEGRFGRRVGQSDDAWVAALDLCLWRGWTDVLRNVEHAGTAGRRKLLKALLTVAPPRQGEVVHAASWLCALDVLTDAMTEAVVPDANRVARILARTQGSFRRWRWEEKPRREKRMRVRWLIDKEADVQAFLLSVLYPYFGEDLEDEQYLQGFGLRQGRFDFAIRSLGVIVEVKMMRTPGGMREIESEIADDLGLYFKEENPFRTMIVYIYDDNNVPQPERYPIIRDSLKRRDKRIVDVVIVPRPSMIPDRDSRNR